MRKRWQSKDLYYVVAPCCDDSAPLHLFAIIHGISPTQIRHITHPRHLAGLEEVVVYLLDNWEEYISEELAGKLLYCVDAGLIEIIPNLSGTQGLSAVTVLSELA